MEKVALEQKLVERDALALYLDKLLNVSLFDDYTTNGLQVEGKVTINHLVTGVTASFELIQKAIECEASAIIVHHGYFWKGENPTITGMKRKRIASLLKNDISLLAYHLPLDCHPRLGNNALLGALLGVEKVVSTDCGGVPDLLWHGAFKNPHTVDTLTKHITSTLKHPPLYLPSKTQKPIQTIAWCTGGADRYIEQAASLGVDAYLTGEFSEQTMHMAKELDIHFFGCGHHATERYGVKALGDAIKEKFNITHTFIDLPNPV